MNNTGKLVGAIALSAVLACPLVGCGGSQGNTQTKTGQSNQTEVSQTANNTSEQTADDGRIDVRSTASATATFNGDKLIASDATTTQLGSESTGKGLGHQEVCVVSQPKSWESIESIAWSRNSLVYTNIEQPWGKLNYTYEYFNEAGVEDLEEDVDESWSQTTPESFFGSMEDVKELEVDGHKIYYVRDDAPSVADRFVYEDFEAQFYGDDRDTSNDVGIHVYEQRGDKCSFVIVIKCKPNEGAKLDTTDEQLVKDAYAVTSFAEAGKANAASYLSDTAITSKSGKQQLVIKREGTDLLSYTPHAVMLSQGTGEDDDEYLMMSYDFATEADAQTVEQDSANVDDYTEENGFASVEVSDIEEHDIDGLKVRARVVTSVQDWDEDTYTERELRGWVEHDGEILLIQAQMKEDESVADALSRIVAGRLVFSAA